MILKVIKTSIKFETFNQINRVDICTCHYAGFSNVILKIVSHEYVYTYLVYNQTPLSFFSNANREGANDVYKH